MLLYVKERKPKVDATPTILCSVIEEIFKQSSKLTEHHNLFLIK